MTRASERLIVSAVRNDDEQPSVYLDLLDPLPADADGALGRPFTPFGRALTTAGVVGALRQVAASVTDEVAAARAGRQLARLADDGVTGADPGQWWSLVPAADDRPRRGPDQAVRVSPSKVEQFAKCELAWLLRASGGDGVKSASASIGTLVHDVVAELGDVDAPTLQAEIERRWAQLGLTPGWVQERQRAEAHAMAGRAAAYFVSPAAAPWERVGVEMEAQVQVGRALLKGRVDRLERHTDGSLRVIDYKTGSSKPTAADLLAIPNSGSIRQRSSTAPSVSWGPDRPGLRYCSWARRRTNRSPCRGSPRSLTTMTPAGPAASLRRLQRAWAGDSSRRRRASTAGCVRSWRPARPGPKGRASDGDGSAQCSRGRPRGGVGPRPDAGADGGHRGTAAADARGRRGR